MLEEQTAKYILCDNCKIKLAEVKNVTQEFTAYCKKCEQSNPNYNPYRHYYHTYDPGIIWYGGPCDYTGKPVWTVDYT